MVEPNWLWGIIEIVLLCVLCVLGVHIFIVLLALGCVFAVLYYGNMASSLSLIAGTAWEHTASYTVSVIALFIFMGTLVEKAGLGKDAYDACMKWLTRIKGSLAIVSVFANALFGAVTGSTIAAIGTIGGVALPEMKRYGYSAELRTGAIASGAVLANLIPPSVAVIFYAIFTEEPVGRLLMAILIPGIILAILFCMVIYIWVSIRPGLAPMLPPDVRFTWGERFRSLSLIAPIAIIFLCVFGGIYLGWFDPTEAGGIGAFAVLVVCLAYRRLDWKNFNSALNSAVKLTAMVLILIVSGFIYAHTIVMTRIGPMVGDFATAAGLTFIPLTYFIILVFIIAGMFLSFWAMIILFIPLFYPVITSMAGAPPMAGIWFGVLVVVLVELAMVTPPMAANIYLTQMIDGCPTKHVILGVIPFYSATAVLLLLLIYFPIIATWLPSMML